MLQIIFLSLLFGITQKLADAVNEHNTSLFKGSNLVFGILFAIVGSLLIVTNSVFYNFYIGLVIYWLLANKLDYFKHQISASIIILVAFSHKLFFELIIVDILFVVLIFFNFKLIKKFIMQVESIHKMAINNKFHHFIIAAIFGLWFSDFKIFISIASTIIGIQIVIRVLSLFNNYQEVKS